MRLWAGLSRVDDYLSSTRYEWLEDSNELDLVVAWCLRICHDVSVKCEVTMLAQKSRIYARIIFDSIRYELGNVSLSAPQRCM